MPPPYQPPPYQPPRAAPYPALYPPDAAQPPRTWLSRNTGWVISLGCLSAVFLVGLFFIGIFGAVMAAMRTSDVYSIAMYTATSDKALLTELGAPIQAGWFVSGSIEVSGGTGVASISIPVSGSLRSGKVKAVAKKSLGRWTFSVLNAEVEGRPAAIDLLPRLPP